MEWFNDTLLGDYCCGYYHGSHSSSLSYGCNSFEKQIHIENIQVTSLQRSCGGFTEKYGIKKVVTVMCIRTICSTGLTPDTYNCGLCKRRECRESHRLQMKLLVSDPGMHHGSCTTHVLWCMSRSLTRSGGENVPGIPGACATRDFARGPLAIVSAMIAESFELTKDKDSRTPEIYKLRSVQNTGTCYPGQGWFVRNLGWGR